MLAALQKMSTALDGCDRRSASTRTEEEEEEDMARANSGLERKKNRKKVAFSYFYA